MFDSFKLSTKKKKIKSLIDNVRYKNAFKYALVEVFMVSGVLDVQKKPLVEREQLAMFNLLTMCGMPENQAKRYEAEYWYILSTSVSGNERSSQTQRERFDAFINARRDIDEITEYDAVREKLVNEKSLTTMSTEVFNIKDLSNQLNHLKTIMPEASEEELGKESIKLREEILLNRFRAEQISYLDYEKSLYTLRGKKWFNYQIKLDEDNDRPDAFMLSFDFNIVFVKWLLQNDIKLTPSESENIEPDSEEYNELLVEKWAKSSLISLAATMLAEDGGDTFRSVVASEPEGTIVEELEIDREHLEEYYGEELSEEQIREIAEKTRNRRMYR